MLRAGLQCVAARGGSVLQKCALFVRVAIRKTSGSLALWQRFKP